MMGLCRPKPADPEVKGLPRLPCVLEITQVQPRMQAAQDGSHTCHRYQHTRLGGRYHEHICHLQ